MALRDIHLKMERIPRYSTVEPGDDVSLPSWLKAPDGRGQAYRCIANDRNTDMAVHQE